MAYRLDVLVRTVVGLVGAYLVASLVAAMLARVIPGDRAEAALAGTIVSFAVFPLVVMTVFAVKRAWLAGVVIAVACALMWAVVSWSIDAGGQL